MAALRQTATECNQHSPCTAPNVDAFLEYLDDVVEWVPAKGHVVLIRHSEQLWRGGSTSGW